MSLIYGLLHRVGTLWIGLSYWTLGPEFDELECTTSDPSNARNRAEGVVVTMNEIQIPYSWKLGGI